MQLSQIIYKTVTIIFDIFHRHISVLESEVAFQVEFIYNMMIFSDLNYPRVEITKNLKMLKKSI